MAYCGTADVAILSQVEYQQLGFGSVGTYNSWLAGTLIPMAQKFVDNYVNHNFSANYGTITCDGSGKETQIIPPSCLVNGTPTHLLPLPLVTVTEVSVDGTVETLSEFQTYKTFITWEDNVFCRGRQNVVIKGTYGFTSVPDDIKYVTAQLCANAVTEMVRKRMLPDLVVPVLTGGGDVGVLFNSPKVLTKNEKEILWQYILHSIEVA